MVDRVATTSKCREKIKEPILAKEIPLPYHPLVFSGFQVKGAVKVEGLTQMVIELIGTLIWPLEDF
jgi:hypothetical protein